jgi:hypothetical protein
MADHMPSPRSALASTDEFADGATHPGVHRFAFPIGCYMCPSIDCDICRFLWHQQQSVLHLANTQCAGCDVGVLGEELSND